MSYQCRNARRDLLRRDQLDAVNRGRLDVHLRLCEHCSDIANEFSLIDSNFQRIPQPSQEKLQAIYCGLEPAVREIVNSKEEGLSSQCLDTQRALLRRDSLNAFRRSRMNIHLRRCESCESIADEFSVIEAGDFRETPQLSRERLQAVYGRLVPVVHEITNEEETS